MMISMIMPVNFIQFNPNPFLPPTLPPNPTLQSLHLHLQLVNPAASVASCIKIGVNELELRSGDTGVDI